MASILLAAIAIAHNLPRPCRLHRSAATSTAGCVGPCCGQPCCMHSARPVDGLRSGGCTCDCARRCWPQCAAANGTREWGARTGSVFQQVASTDPSVLDFFSLSFLSACPSSRERGNGVRGQIPGGERRVGSAAGPSVSTSSSRFLPSILPRRPPPPAAPSGCCRRHRWSAAAPGEMRPFVSATTHHKRRSHQYYSARCTGWWWGPLCAKEREVCRSCAARHGSRPAHEGTRR